MNLNRFGASLAVLASVVALVSACAKENDSSVACGGSARLRASGSTAQANAMARFVKVFEQACPGQSLNYTANGSGAGISEFLDNQTDFGASDAPLSRGELAKAEQRCGAPAWNLPLVFGPIAIAYHISGVTSLNLDGPTAAKIFNGGITTWNDPAIQELNSGVTLPAEPIVVVFRSDESGTSDNFQRYLDTASGGGWGKGAGKLFSGGVGQGVAGSDGAAAAVESGEGTLTYVEWWYAQAHRLDVAKIITSAGPDPVAISADSVGKAISAAWFIRAGNDLALDTISLYRPNRAGAYPIVLATYGIVCSKYPDPQVGAAVKAFLQSATGTGQNGLADDGYVAIPDEFRPRLAAAVNALA